MTELHMLNINTMANNAGFGLEYLLHNNIGTRTRIVLQEGIELCAMIERGGLLKDIISDSELDTWEFMQTLNGLFTPEEVIDIIKRAKEIKQKLEYATTKAVCLDSVFSIEDIRKMQSFFNYVGHPFLAKAMTSMQRRSRNRISMNDDDEETKRIIREQIEPKLAELKKCLREADSEPEFEGCQLLNPMLIVAPHDEGEPPNWVPAYHGEKVVWVSRNIFENLKKNRQKKPCFSCPAEINKDCKLRPFHLLTTGRGDGIT